METKKTHKKSMKGAQKIMHLNHSSEGNHHYATDHDHNKEADHIECLIKIDSVIFKLWEVTYLFINCIMFDLVGITMTSHYLT